MSSAVCALVAALLAAAPGAAAQSAQGACASSKPNSACTAIPQTALEPRASPSTAPGLPSPADTADGDRIVDRPIAPHGAGWKVARVPLAPFLLFGTGFEKGLKRLEYDHLQLKLKHWMQQLERKHIQPMLGGLGTGTGFAVGVKIFDHEFLHRRVRLEIPLQQSPSNYLQYGSLLAFNLAGERALFLEFSAQFRNRPKEDFFGLGNDSVAAFRTTYKLVDRSAGAALGTEFFGRTNRGMKSGVRLEASARYINTNIYGGLDDNFPVTQAVFPTLNGLARGSSLLRYGFSGSYYILDNPSDPHAGFRARAKYYRVDSRNSDPFNFNESGATAEGYIPLGKPRTLALRLLSEFRSARNGGRVPFYHLPFLGGSSTMRGFREFRFYDNAALLINLEYRYRVWKALDLVVFHDNGQVAPRGADFTWERFRGGFGGGMRVKGKKGATLQFFVGRSSEGTRYYISFKPEF